MQKLGSENIWFGNRRKMSQNVNDHICQLLLLLFIRMFKSLMDPDPLVRGADPNPYPAIIKQKWEEKP